MMGLRRVGTSPGDSTQFSIFVFLPFYAYIQVRSESLTTFQYDGCTSFYVSDTCACGLFRPKYCVCVRAGGRARARASVCVCVCVRERVSSKECRYTYIFFCLFQNGKNVNSCLLFWTTKSFQHGITLKDRHCW